MKQFMELTGEDICTLGNQGYRLAGTKPATAADELPFGENTVVLLFKAAGKDILEYTANVPADQSVVLEECVDMEPVGVFVRLWRLRH